jgi:hypothetical protein
MFKDQCARNYNGFVSESTEMGRKVRCDLFNIEYQGASQDVHRPQNE